MVVIVDLFLLIFDISPQFKETVLGCPLISIHKV